MNKINNKRIFIFVLTAALVLNMGISSYAAGVAPATHSGNDSGSVAPSGYKYHSFGSNGSAGTYTVKFDAGGNVDPNISHIHWVTQAGQAICRCFPGLQTSMCIR